VLYSPEDVTESFYAQLLNVYSLIVAAMIAIGEKNLTKMHAVIALTLAASPLSLYLIFYVVRSLLGKANRLEAVFGKGKYMNRTPVLIMLPLWATVLSFTTLPTSVWQFQQAACDTCVLHYVHPTESYSSVAMSRGTTSRHCFSCRLYYFSSQSLQI
jgi:hypothetical protein